MFPSGLPGLALLLLRASVALAILLQDYTHRDAFSGWVHGAALLLSAALAVGYATPIVALMALGFHGFAWFSTGGDSAVWVSITALDALALALLGPGAYSVDSCRFGRRVVTLPPP